MGKRRYAAQLRAAAPKKLDQQVFVASYIQDGAEWLEWRGYNVSLRKAQEMLAAGEVAPVTRKTENGIITFFRRSMPEHASRPTPCTLTMSTMVAVYRRATGQRLTRSEQAQVDKFHVWPEIGDTKAVAVRPRMDDRMRLQAKEAMDRAEGVHAVTHNRVGRSGIQVEYYDAPEPVAA